MKGRRGKKEDNISNVFQTYMLQLPTFLQPLPTSPEIVKSSKRHCGCYPALCSSSHFAQLFGLIREYSLFPIVLHIKKLNRKVMNFKNPEEVSYCYGNRSSCSLYMKDHIPHIKVALII